MPMIKAIKPFVATFFSERVLIDNVGPDGTLMTPANDKEKDPFVISGNDDPLSQSTSAKPLIDVDEKTSRNEDEQLSRQRKDPLGNPYTTKHGIEYGYHGGLGLIFKYPGDPKKLRERSKMKLWRDYFRLNGRNLTLLRYPSFNRLVQVGLPSRLRGEIWEITSGSVFLRLQNPGEYARVLKESEGKKSLARDEIEKDLNRSLPEYPAYQDEEGIGTLRRVLTAYAWKNPVRTSPLRECRLNWQRLGIGLLPGYEHCRGSFPHVCCMMAVAHMLADIQCSYLSEEQCFWLLSMLCDRLVPGYYT